MKPYLSCVVWGLLFVLLPGRAAGEGVAGTPQAVPDDALHLCRLSIRRLLDDALAADQKYNPEDPCPLARRLAVINGFPSDLARQVNDIVREGYWGKDNNMRFYMAVTIAANYRLASCVNDMLPFLHYTYTETIPKPTLSGGVTPIRQERHLVVEALVKIGKPSVAPILQYLVTMPEPSYGVLDLAGEVVSGVEGELAVYAVEAFISKSPDPAKTRAVLEGEAFAKHLKSKPPRQPPPPR